MGCFLHRALSIGERATGCEWVGLVCRILMGVGPAILYGGAVLINAPYYSTNQGNEDTVDSIISTVLYTSYG